MQRKPPFAGDPGMRVEQNFLRRINVISPVQPYSQKYSASRLTQISHLSAPSRSQGGAARDRHGRRERDAVDADGALDETR
jgi:hypothetical protein